MITDLRSRGAAALALAFAGCAASTHFVSNKSKDANPSPRRIYVASHLLDMRAGPNFGENFAGGFDARLTEDFKACGTEVLINEATGHDLDDGELTSRIESFKPDTVLMIHKTQWSVNRLGVLTNATYGFDFLEIPDKAGARPGRKARPKAVWRSTMSFRPVDTMLSAWKTQGASVADDLVKRMQDDGFFPGCMLPRAK